MNKKIKIYGILFGLVYVAIVIFSLTNSFVYMAGEFKDGYHSVTPEGKEAARSYKILHFKALPIGARYADSLENLKTNEIVTARTKSFAVKVNPPKASTIKTLTDIAAGLFAFAILAILILIPIWVFKIIRSIVKDNVFNKLTISRLRRIGRALLYIFAYCIFTYLKDFIYAKSVLELQNYKIIFSIGESYFYLIMGIMALLFAEILKTSTQIKEENDLTV